MITLQMFSSVIRELREAAGETAPCNQRDAFSAFANNNRCPCAAGPTVLKIQLLRQNAAVEPVSTIRRYAQLSSGGG